MKPLLALALLLSGCTLSRVAPEPAPTPEPMPCPLKIVGNLEAILEAYPDMEIKRAYLEDYSEKKWRAEVTIKVKENGLLALVSAFGDTPAEAAITAANRVEALRTKGAEERR